MKAKYAIRALAVLAEKESDMFSIRLLSQKAKISQKFLESIMLELKKHKLVDSKRGASGGYFLAKPAKKISIGNIIRFIDGPLAPIQCASVTAYKKCKDCPTSEKRCRLHHIMVDARNAIASVLDNRTLKDMINSTNSTNEKNKNNNNHNYTSTSKSRSKSSRKKSRKKLLYSSKKL